ncbi:MAG: methyl-accepting chemotaxis protein, partial [Treponema sp.]|nr:methyl-accepting chemotaxis protein [Treponema sp.]
MKIGVKLVAVISMVNLIGIGLLAGVTLIQSQREISRLVDEEAASIAQENGERISKWFESHISATRNVAQIMEGYKEIPVTQRRDYFNITMRQVLSATPGLQGMYANWAPEAMDGLDAEYANTPGNDATGRFIPIWSISGGETRLTHIVNFDWERVMQIPLFNTEYILDPSVYTGLTGSFLIANMGHPVRDKETGALIGLSGASIVLSTIQTMVEQIKPFGDGTAMLFSSGGIVAAHSDPERLGKNMKETEADTFGPFLDTMVDAVTKGTGASFSYQSPQSDTVVQYYAVPFSIGEVPQPWTLVIAVSHNTVMAPVYRMLTISLIIGLLSMSVMSIGVLFMARSISYRIKRLALMLKDIAEGEGDLTKTISIIAHDEIGDLAHYFNLTITKIKELVIAIRNEALALSQTGAELAGNMNETASSINEITSTIQSIKTQTSRQQASVKGTGTIMEQVVANIETLNSRIQKQS